MRKFLAIIFLLVLCSACTPQQLQTLERLGGFNLSPETEAVALSLADGPMFTKWGWVQVDGTVTEHQAPAGSKCPQWYATAMEAGWQPEHWSKLDAIIWRESRCQPGADSGPDHGLTQVNQIHKKYLIDIGLNHDLMFDPYWNLWFAHKLFSDREAAGKCGWQPWKFSGQVWC